MDARRALSIRVGSVRRLGADVRSYERELSSYSSMLAAAEAAGDDASAIRRHREFVQECQATILDIRTRLRDAVMQLHRFVQSNTQLIGSEDWDKAQQLLKEHRSALDSLDALQQRAEGKEDTGQAAAASAFSPSSSVALPSASPSVSLSSDASSAPPPLPPPPPPHRFSVAVYGGSQVKAGDATWTYALQLGQALAEHDFHIVATPRTITAALLSVVCVVC